jgi:hypothetical protein
MAEAIGIGIGVLSFAVQIGDSLIKLKNFADSMKNASDDLQQLIRRVENITTVLDDLDRDGPGVIDGVHTQGCREAAGRLTKIVKDIEKVLVSKSRRGGFKYAVSKKNVEEFERQLDCEISTLELFLLDQTR